MGTPTNRTTPRVWHGLPRLRRPAPHPLPVVGLAEPTEPAVATNCWTTASGDSTKILICDSATGRPHPSRSLIMFAKEMKPVSHSPPKGATYQTTFDGFVIECSTRSGEAFILVPFTLVWSGFSLGGIYGSQFSSGAFNPGMSFFGLIFVVGSIFLISKTLMTVFGEVRFELKGDTLYYFSGLHPVGKRKRIDWRSLAVAREEVESWGKRGRANHAIFLEGSERHVVGHPLSASHRYFVVGVLNEHLQKKEANIKGCIAA